MFENRFGFNLETPHHIRVIFDQSPTSFTGEDYSFRLRPSVRTVCLILVFHTFFINAFEELYETS